MRFFTPALYLQLQDHDDATIDAADGAWDAAGEAYVRRLDEIRDALPEAIRKLNEIYYLHDAVVSRLARAGDDFLIEVRPIYPPEDLILLRYSLVAEPIVNTEALPGDKAAPIVEWMYDEVDFDAGSGATTHDILFSNGWELGLRFHAVEMILARDLLPAPERRGASTVAKTA